MARARPRSGVAGIATTAASVVALALLGLSLSGCATNAATGKQNLMLVGQDEEVELSEKEHRAFVRRPGLYTDEALLAYVREVGGRIAAESARPEIEYRFFVLNQPDVNAFALPDGRIYVTRGLLAFLDNEAELAAVLAHEVVHVEARHSAQLMSSAKVAGVLSTAVGLMAGAAVAAATGDANLAMSTMDAASGASSIAGVLVLGNYSREHELEADSLGARYMARAGYPGHAMVGVLDALSAIEDYGRAHRKTGDAKRHVYHQVATHPDLEQRIREVVATAAPGPQPEEVDAGSAVYRERTAGLVFEPLDAPLPNQIAKNRFLQRESRLEVHLPPDWTVTDSSAEHVTLQKTAEGLTTTFRLLPPAADQDAEKFFAGTPLEAQSTRAVEALNPIYDKVPAFSAFVDLAAEGGSQTAYAAVVFHEARTVLLTGTSADAEWLKTHRYVFDAQANLANLLAPEEYEARRTKRVQTIEAKAGDTYATLAQASPLGAQTEDYLRLLNRQYPSGEPSVGQKLKIVVADP